MCNKYKTNIIIFYHLIVNHYSLNSTKIESHVLFITAMFCRSNNMLCYLMAQPIYNINISVGLVATDNALCCEFDFCVVQNCTI